jgi:RNA 2',3'-cyclic 3'-phosphodiesterase
LKLPTGRRGDPFAGIPGRRLFIAVPLPDDAAAAVADVVEEVRGQGLPAGQRDVRWVRLDSLHLTLRFLGPTADERVAPTSAVVESVAASVPGPIDLELRGAGAFPPVGRPRTIWIGIGDGATALTELAVGLQEALRTVGWASDERPFRAHLTLARSDGVAAGSLVAGRLEAVMANRRIAGRASQLGLFESITGGGPARYVPVTVRPFGDTPG